MIGQTLSNFQISAKLGEGGMGEVYRSQDTKLGREVAIKVLPETVAEDPERLARFEREAIVLAALDHSSIAAIYGLEEVDGRQLLIMQLAEGETLQERIARGPVPLEHALPIALQIAEAMEVDPTGDTFQIGQSEPLFTIAPTTNGGVDPPGLAQRLSHCLSWWAYKSPRRSNKGSTLGSCPRKRR